MTDNMFRWDRDDAGIITLTMDDPTAKVNTMNDKFVADLQETVNKLEEAVAGGDVTGIIITSAKKTFFAGGDIAHMVTVGPEDAESMAKFLAQTKDGFRRLEKLPVPVVAAINGAALGGGLEVALACNYRIAAGDVRAKLGLPEVTLGLLPGGGGITRVVRMLGIQSALMDVILTGAQMDAEKAKDKGLIDEVVPLAELLNAARAYLTGKSDAGVPRAVEARAVQPWDEKGYRMPGGTPSTPKLAVNLPSFPANLVKQLKGAPFVAPKRAMQAAIEGAQVDFDTAQLIESRYFIELVTGSQSKNMMQAFFFDLNHAKGGGSRPKQADGTPYPVTEFKKVAVVGAGMMGAGIAYVCAKSGMDVVLKDISMENAERGKQYSVGLEEKALKRSKTTEEKSAALLGRITPTDSYDDLADVDLVIEAVFENTDLKHKVHAEIEAAVPNTAILGSNTSTLPITELAEHVDRSGDFIGLHFFSPVDKMQLIEIISGDQTKPETLAAALDFAVAIRKLPIVVNDSRGFYTSRVIGTVINEAMRMVVEGYAPATVEAAARQAGYPASQLQLADELNLKLMQKISAENATAAEAAGRKIDDGGVAKLVAEMLELGRHGKLDGKGFYEYVDGRRAGLWPGLAELDSVNKHKVAAEDVDLQELIDRMLFIEALETQLCFDEGVIEADADANIGSIFGIGYPAWTGGTRQFVKNYDGAATSAPERRGVAGFVARADELAAKFGERFTAPDSLR
ncbi:3-hydroxyacyl-CoA dehydrogenase NAD-binding domain-containing protein [Corynebacterium ulceribovis]|uniref:3-hydroxyacyl-CoA dehydrogenase NAD-binding domain-containing protein n=1 Tax=Corynebacterium ulceribovis TaxID=487732 RepID=UPI00037990D7|nr:3-hydroxyacyl-CoA dehydrogenase NAD-binding domain-containing protein [Corynebacterium ulceribovis]